MDIQQVCISSALSGSLVALLCTPFDVVKNYWQYTAISSSSSPGARGSPPPPAAAAAADYYRAVTAATAAAGRSQRADGAAGTSSSSSSSSSSSGCKAQGPCAKVGVNAKTSSMKVAANLYRARGPLVFWRGLGPAIGVLVPANIIFFSLYERRNPEGSAAAAGVAARTAAVVFTAPIELVRTQLQARCCTANTKSAAFFLLQQTLRNEGVGGLFKGVVPTIIRDAPFSAFYWPLTEAANRAFRRLLTASNSSENTTTTTSSSSSSSLGVVQGFRDRAIIPFLSGASSAAVACVLTHPFDVIKTRVQAAQLGPRAALGEAPRGPVWYLSRGVREAFYEVYAAQGLKGFGVGLLPRLLKIVPSCAVLLATYEATKALWGSSLLDQM